MGLFGFGKPDWEKQLWSPAYRMHASAEDIISLCDRKLASNQNSKDDLIKTYEIKSEFLYVLKRFDECLDYCEKKIDLQKEFYKPKYNPRKAYALIQLNQNEEALDWINQYEQIHDEVYFSPYSDVGDGSFFESKTLAMINTNKSKDEILGYLQHIQYKIKSDKFLDRDTLQYDSDTESKLAMLRKLAELVHGHFNPIILDMENVKKFMRTPRYSQEKDEEPFPDDIPKILFNRAIAAFFDGRFTAAQNTFLEVLAIDPEDNEAKDFLEKCNDELSK